VKGPDKESNTGAMACGFEAKKYDPPQAFSKAVAYVNRLIALSKDASIGSGHGPLLHHALNQKF